MWYDPFSIKNKLLLRKKKNLVIKCEQYVLRREGIFTFYVKYFVKFDHFKRLMYQIDTLIDIFKKTLML